MNKITENYIKRVAESKTKYHTKQAQLPYEEKVSIIIKLQQIDFEMSRMNENRKGGKRFKRLWEIEMGE